MRCSSCEPLLDRYVEATLPPREMAAITAHLAHCFNCRDLIAQLKVVDGLLFTTHEPELPANFTFAVMAEIQSLPGPRSAHHPLWSFLALYSTAAWVATVIGLIVTRTSPQTALSVIASLLARAGLITSSVAASVASTFTHTLPALAAFGAFVLIIDIAIAGAFAFVYLVVRPRLAAQLVSVPEAAP